MFFCPTAVANSAGRWSGFSYTSGAVTSATTYDASVLYTPSSLYGAVTNVGFYAGDYNLFSSSGFIYSARLKVALRAPAATFAAQFFTGTLNYGQLADGITVA